MAFRRNFPPNESDFSVNFQGTCCFTPLELSGRKIAPNTGANATKFFTLATKS